MEDKSSIDLQRFYPESLQITIKMKSRKHSHKCPKCGEEANKYHAVYTTVGVNALLWG